MAVIALARKIRRGMAVQAAPILKDSRQTQEQLLSFDRLGWNSRSDLAARCAHGEARCEHNHRKEPDQ